MGTQKAKGGGAKKHGRDKDKCAHYRKLQIREKNKIVRIAKSNNGKIAMAYAQKHGLETWARKRLSKLTRVILD